MNHNTQSQSRWGWWLAPGLVTLLVAACSPAAVEPSSQNQVSAKPTETTAVATEVNTPIADATPAPPVERSQTTAPVAAAPNIATYTPQQAMAGFSSDGQYFMILESWRDTGAGIPHAAMQTVQLSSNTCVAQGCARTRLSESQSNQTTDFAENSLLQQTQDLRQSLQLTSPTPGQVLPIQQRSRTANGTETVRVQLANQQPLTLTLRQQQGVRRDGDAEIEQAAMQLEVMVNGQRRSLGSLRNLQDWQVAYTIREVRQSPDGKTIAVLITAAERAFEGTLGLTRVQGFSL